MEVWRLRARRCLVALIAVLMACGGGAGTSVAPAEDASGGEDAVRADAPAEDGLPAEVSGSDVTPDDSEEDTVAPRPELPPEYTCGALDALIPCEAVGPAPADAASIAQFTMDNAVPLLCTDGLGEHWDFDVFASEFEGHAAFFMGEVHGSDEIGPASADLFEALVYGAGVTVVALEMGMDTSAAYNEYILTGDETVLDDGFYWGQYTDSMFRKTIPRRARKIYEETGIQVTVLGVDSPLRLAWVNERIVEVATPLSVPAQSLLLDVLPAPKEPPYGFMGLDSAYVALTKNYHQHVMDNEDEICAGLSPDACEDIEFLAYALYVGAVFNSSDFQKVMMGQGNPLDMMIWMSDRETLLDYNFRRALPDEDTVLYAHMGAAHCAKGSWNVAGLIDAQHPPAQGRVYSVSPAWGQGSKVFYGMSAQAVPAEPTALAGLLSQMPMENYFMASSHPGKDCTANPFADDVAQQVGGTYGTSYDAFFWFKMLTPEKSGWSKPSPGKDWRADFIRDQVERMRFADRMMEELR